MRIEAATGPIHVWTPPGASSRRGTVLYVHGYGTTADDAMGRYRLEEQFLDSGLDATFVVPEAPRSRYDPVRFPSLAALLDEVRRHTMLGTGPVVAVGHSGAFRTLVHWLSDPRLSHIILLDALYGRYDDFLKWGRDPSHRLTVVVGPDTTPPSERLVKALGGRVLARIPTDVRPYWFDRVIGMHSQYSHMGLVSNDVVIPVLLRRTMIARLGGRSPVPPRPRPVWPWVLVALSGLLVGGSAWYFWRRTRHAPEALPVAVHGPNLD